jgi:sialate O-acetylesterase
LAGCSGGKDPTWPYLREAQLMTLSLPNTGMATAIDIGNPSDIHPKDKHDVGHRLALVARHVAYGENLVFSGPIYSAMKVDGNAIDLTFTNMGQELGSRPGENRGRHRGCLEHAGSKSGRRSLRLVRRAPGKSLQQRKPGRFLLPHR